MDPSSVHADLGVSESGPIAGSSGQSRRAPRDQRLGGRVLFMIGSLIGYSLAELLVKGLMLVQLLVRIFTGAPSERLLDPGERLSRYIYSAWRYLCFCAEDPPWPMSRWR